MPRSLPSLPLDVFYNVASSLDLESVVSLSRTNRQLHSLFQEESLCRKMMKTHARYTKEARLARTDPNFTYRKALSRLSDVREAYKTAQPYSCAVLGYGATFLYRQGVLCYLYGSQVRFLNVHDWAKREQFIDVRSLIDEKLGRSTNHSPGKITLLNYQDHVLALNFELQDEGGEEDDGITSWLVVIDHLKRPPDSPIKYFHRLNSPSRMFVRQDGSHLYYGVHTGISAVHGHREWVVEGVNLETGDPMKWPKNWQRYCDSGWSEDSDEETGKEDGRHEMVPFLQLEHFVGSDIGLTVCFEIYNGYFYALSNQTSFDVEEIDWTSYYNCIRFSIADPSIIQGNDCIWRRQHSEGPINDTWTDLSLHLDERTNKVFIVECRREWKDGGSTSARTFYNAPLPFKDVILPGQDDDEPLYALDAADYSIGYAGLPDDILTTQIDETNKFHYEPGKVRLSRREHPEYTHKDPPSREFILAKTKHRAYNLSCSAFLDLVNDPINIRPVPRDRLRLRIGHRKLSSPLYFDKEEEAYRLRKRMPHPSGGYIPGSEELFEDRGIAPLWPPDDAPEELVELLCPLRNIGQVEAASDERSLIYMLGPSYLKDRPIILINFDPSACILLKEHPGTGFSGLRRLRMPVITPMCPGKGKEAVGVEVERMRAGEIRGQQRTVTIEPVAAKTSGPSTSSTDATPVPFIKEEWARYLFINKGFWLR